MTHPKRSDAEAIQSLADALNEARAVAAEATRMDAEYLPHEERLEAEVDELTERLLEGGPPVVDDAPLSSATSVSVPVFAPAPATSPPHGVEQPDNVVPLFRRSLPVLALAAAALLIARVLLPGASSPLPDDVILLGEGSEELGRFRDGISDSLTNAMGPDLPAGRPCQVEVRIDALLGRVVEARSVEGIRPCAGSPELQRRLEAAAVALPLGEIPAEVGDGWLRVEVTGELGD